ncbi:MAG: type II CAAX endopeptidase family protein [Clostridiaceae bacterium]|nr:type II CAAX endopeptidase family protein [Clostridiaceae bacterium]
MEVGKSKKLTSQLICVTVIIMLISVIDIIIRHYVHDLIGIGSNILYYVLITSVVIVTVFKVEKRDIKSLGFYKENIIKQIIIGLIIFGTFAAINVIPLLFNVDKSYVVNFKPKSVEQLVSFLLFDIFCVGFGEEIIYRGYFLPRIKDITNSWIVAILVSSIVFGLWHLPSQPITPAIIGIIFATLKVKAKDCSTLSLSIAHGFNDAFLILLGWILL